MFGEDYPREVFFLKSTLSRINGQFDSGILFIHGRILNFERNKMSPCLGLTKRVKHCLTKVLGKYFVL